MPESESESESMATAMATSNNVNANAQAPNDITKDKASPTSTASSSSPARCVLRVSREIESIGARVPMSKKRITWQFVFADSAQVHTVVLEHSRVTLKKRLHLDGAKLYSSEHYCAGDWTHKFQVQAPEHPAVFCVIIRDVKGSVADAGVYQLTVDDVAWEQLDERLVPREKGSDSIWSSDLFARRVSADEEVLQCQDDDGHQLSGKSFYWTFAFGTPGTIHRFELRDAERDDKGEFMVILDSRLLTQVAHDDVEADFWEYECHATDQHQLKVVVTLLGDDGKKYEFYINGCPWEELGETDFVLQPDWFPVYSRSQKTSYYRNAKTGVCRWERPVQNRKGSVIDVPRRMSKIQVPVPTDEFNAEGLRRSSEKVPEHDHPSPVFGAVVSPSAPKPEPEINLIDFSEMSVHASPTSKQQPIMKKPSAEQGLDLLS